MRYINAAESLLFHGFILQFRFVFKTSECISLRLFSNASTRAHTFSKCLHWFVIVRLDVLSLNIFFYFINMTETTFVVPCFIYLDVIWIMKQQHLFFQKCFYLYRNEEEWEGEKAKRGSNNAKQIWKNTNCEILLFIYIKNTIQMPNNNNSTIKNAWVSETCLSETTLAIDFTFPAEKGDKIRHNFNTRKH